MSFQLGRWYVLGATKNTYLVKWDGGPLLTFEMWSVARTGGTVDVSLLDKEPTFPYGITCGSGPWYLVSSGFVSLVRSHDTTAAARANLTYGAERIHRLDMGVPWLLDSAALGL